MPARVVIISYIRRYPMVTKSAGRAISKLVIACLLLSLLVTALPSKPALAATTTYQAENATISQAVVESNHAGFTGTGFVNYNNVVGSFVEFTVSAAAASNAMLSFRYANGTTTNRPMSISVNGTVVSSSLAFNPTGAWTTWAT